MTYPDVPANGARDDADGASPSRARRGALAPNPRLWEALGRGPLLREILVDFYAIVYRDPQLAPFFQATTIEWAIDHQYAFLADIFAGTSTFFGYRPRNAHHWMVISRELFDHREALMERCLREHGMAEDLILAWREVEEVFRCHIVKDHPMPRVRGGVVMPLDGLEQLTLDAGGTCDGCDAVIARGGSSFYHVRTGKAYCLPCSESRGATTGGPAQ